MRGGVLKKRRAALRFFSENSFFHFGLKAPLFNFLIFSPCGKLDISLGLLYFVPMASSKSTTMKFMAGAPLTNLIRAVLYSTRLSWGAKCLAFAFLDTPIGASPTNAQLARKLRADPSQVSVWRHQLEQNSITIRLNEKERTLEAKMI